MAITDMSILRKKHLSHLSSATIAAAASNFEDSLSDALKSDSYEQMTLGSLSLSITFSSTQ